MDMGIDYYEKLTLTEQFLFICVSIIVIVIISLGMVLPKTLLPVYEENLYNYLNQSLNLLENLRIIWLIVRLHIFILMVIRIY